MCTAIRSYCIKYVKIRVFTDTCSLYTGECGSVKTQPAFSRILCSVLLQNEKSLFCRVSKTSNICGNKLRQWKPKSSRVSIPPLQGYLGMTELLNQCLNLCSFKWRRCNLRRKTRFSLAGWKIENKKCLCFSFIIDLSNAWINSDLILFHLSIQ